MDYRNTVFRLLENLDVPRKGLVGPWAHKYPNIAYPNPKMDYVKESVRWWDRWLKGIENGIDDEPALTYYMLDSVRPQTDYEHRSGQWISEPSWPSPRTLHKNFYPANGQLHDTPQTKAHGEQICSPQTVGLNGGRLCVGIRLDMEQPADQRVDDAGSLCFDTLPLQQDLAIAGQIIANLAIRCDKPTANIAVRVCDVHPDGAVTRISLGVLNLTHRDSHEDIEALTLGKLYHVAVPVNHIAYKLPKGHRLRISLSTACWPLIWPAPDHATLTLEASKSHIDVPYRDNLRTEIEPPKYNKAVSFDGETQRESDSQRIVHQDYKTGLVTLETHDDFGRQHYHSCDADIDMKMSQWQTIHPEDPLSAQSTLSFKLEMGRDGWWTGLKSQYAMRCDYHYFYVTSTWQAFHDGQCIFKKEFTEKIKRTAV